jgi:serine/threonine protein kinase
MGKVFAARDRILDRDVAIKVSHAQVPGGDLDERLKAEARVLATLEHPGIVPVHDLQPLADGRFCCVMKLVQGQTLAAQSAQLRTESARLAVFERVVEAVAFAHAQGIVHRDLSPANVMVGRFGEVLVMDWGLARLLADANPGGERSRVGTPGFMPPEQADERAPEPGPPADVFALGALLAWMFRDEPRVPRRLRAIMAMCRRPRPEDRYADASALAADLARYRAGEAVQALPETILDQAWRFATTHATLLLLIATYLIMRVVVGVIQAR